MRLTYGSGKFIFECNFYDKDVPKQARFRWNPETKKWWTDNIENAAMLRGYADPIALAVIEEGLDARTDTLEASRATDAAIDLPCPDGLEYMPFQKAGIAFGMARETVLIGDEMGLGKTIQALGLINADESVRRVLVICPASLKLNWAREAKKWLVRPMVIGIADSKVFPSMANLIVINYDILDKYASALRAQEWDMMVCDEAHYMKNPKTLRTRQVLGGTSRKPGDRIDPIPARRKVFLTGTPIVNRPIELWPIVKSAGVFTNWKHYVERYCSARQGRYGWEVGGASNLPELQQKLRSTIMVRRLKKDVLTDLPAKRRQVIELPANGCTEYIAAEWKAWEKQKEIIDRLQTAVELSKASENPSDHAEAVKRLRAGITAAFTEMAKARLETARAKLPYVIESLKDSIENSGKVVVFAHHHEIIDTLFDEFKDQAVKLDGRDKLTDRQTSVDRFQNDPEVKLFIGQMQSAGVGITLTASSHVIFSELDWVPGNLSQAEDRTHRIGQQNSVLVQHLVLEGSIDAVMARRIVQKQAVIDRALDRQFEVKDEPEIPVREDSEIATKEVTRKEVVKEAETITPEEIKTVHASLRYLAALCDGAMAQDGTGFNKFDAPIGRNLAYEASLTPKQAILGRKIIKKYRKQLESALITV